MSDKPIKSSNKTISNLAAVLVFLLAVGAFILSYNALYHVALDNGIQPNLAWLWPLLVDFALIVFSLAILRAHLLKESVVWPWTLTGLFALATIAFNLIHAPEGFTSHIVAVIPPIALVLSFEALMQMIKSSVVRSSLVDSLSDLAEKINQKRVALERIEAEKTAELDNLISEKQTEIDRLTASAVNLVNEFEANRQELDGQIETMKRTMDSYRQDIEAKKEEVKRLEVGPVKAYIPSGLTIEQRQELVNLMANDGQTNEQIASVLGVSIGTVKNDKKATKEASLIHTNGKAS